MHKFFPTIALILGSVILPAQNLVLWTQPKEYGEYLAKTDQIVIEVQDRTIGIVQNGMFSVFVDWHGIDFCKKKAAADLPLRPNPKLTKTDFLID